jgi:hypothetical protein
MGSALLKDPDRAAKILQTLKTQLLGPLGKPLSCKIRLLETTEETVSFVERMIRAGADAVAIHARRVGHESTVAADWKSLEEVLGILRRKHPDFNLLVNGDFYDRTERAEFVERTKVDGVLLGRPALYNTSTFLPLSNPTTTSSSTVTATTTTLPLVDKTAVVQEYLRLSVRYDSHHKNTKYVICEMMSHRRTPTGRVPYLAMKFPQGQTVGMTCNCHDLDSLCKVWNVDYSEAIAATSAARVNASGDCGTRTASATKATLVAGEHRYEDSYFLKTVGATASDAPKAVGIAETKTGDGNAAQTSNKRSNRDPNDDDHADLGPNDDNVTNTSKRTKIVAEEATQPPI